MPKQIVKKYWSFAEIKEVKITPSKFLFWKYDDKEVIYKYNHPSELLDEVNKFIADNHISDIIKFNDNARWQIYEDYDTETREREGGIHLVYTINVLHQEMNNGN